MLSDELESEVPEDTPWYTKGYESRTRAEARVHRVGQWVRNEMINNSSGMTGDDVLVLMVTHGQMIAQTSNFLLHQAFTNKPEENENVSFEGIRNTSVTSFLLPSSEYDYPGDRPNAQGNIIRYDAKIDFFNDTTHLGDEQLHLFAEGALGMPMQLKKARL